MINTQHANTVILCPVTTYQSNPVGHWAIGFGVHNLQEEDLWVSIKHILVLKKNLIVGVFLFVFVFVRFKSSVFAFLSCEKLILSLWASTND